MIRRRCPLKAFAGAALMSGLAHGQITDLNTWTLIEDPADPSFSASVDGPSQATLTAGDAAIPSATDIGFASADAATPGGGTTGFAFDPGQDFTVAIDFDLTFATSPAAAGGLSFGFGIGEDLNGTNSAGVAINTVNGLTTGLAIAAARTNDVDASPVSVNFNAITTGSLFVAYHASTGDVSLSVSSTPGAAAGFVDTTLVGVQNGWTGQALLASFFLRSQSITTNLGTVPAWSAGGADAVFSNFRVLEGAPIAVPEPASLVSLAAGGLVLAGRPSRR